MEIKMILVDVFVPSVNNVYDFRLDEKTPVQNVIEEICELIEMKEHCNLMGDIGSMMLCCQKRGRILPGYCTLSECGINTGSSLILV